MQNVGIVRGSAEQAKPVVINVDTVYVHHNIKEIKNEEGQIEYEYEEVQYSLKEYAELQQEQLETTTEDITNIQLALAELVEGGILNND